MTNSIIKSRNYMIQLFRALSIIAVVMIHTSPSGLGQVFSRPFINFAVATFIFLSGYLTKLENDNWFAFCKKRIVRVAIPYIIWTIVYSLFSIIYRGGDSYKLLKNLLSAQAVGTLYYIFVYIQFVLLTPFLARLIKSKYRHLAWFVAPVSLLVFKYYGLVFGVKYDSYISLFWSDSCLGWFSYYYLGLLLGNKLLKFNYSLKSVVFLYTVSIILQMAESYGWFLLGDTNCGSQLKISSLLSNTLFIFIVYDVLNRRNIEIKSRFLISLGDYSFGIYLCHMMIIFILQALPFVHLAFPLNSFLVLIISWGCCYLGYKIFGEKIGGWLGLR